MKSYIDSEINHYNERNYNASIEIFEKCSVSSSNNKEALEYLRLSYIKKRCYDCS